MRIEELSPPRVFQVPSGPISHCANISLDPDEQITFTSGCGKEYDVVKKTWGFFATPSINNRLKKFGYKTALISDANDKKFICLVEEDKVDEFLTFLDRDAARVLCWLSEPDES